MRGLPHLHGVFWLEEEAIKKYKDENGNYKDNITELIDKWVSVSLETKNPALNDLVKEVNVHHHTNSCKKGTNTCRFSFPRLPSDETLIAYPIPELVSKKESKNYKEILDKVSEKQKESTDEQLELFKMDPEEYLRKLCINIDDYTEAVRWQEIKKKSDDSKKVLEKVKKKLTDLTDEELGKYNNNLTEFLREELSIDINEYNNALRISHRGQTIILKRKLNERMVNNYHPHFLLTWQANMDIQFALDNYAVITYITDYLTKGDAGLTQELRKALIDCKGCNNFDTLNYLKMVYFKHKQVSVCEATYRLLRNLPMKHSNISCLNVANGFPENRSTFFRKAVSMQNESVIARSQTDKWVFPEAAVKIGSIRTAWKRGLLR